MKNKAQYFLCVEKWKPADTGNKKQLRAERPKKTFGKRVVLPIDA